MKKDKRSLKRDTVESKNFHVGIELELITPHEGECGHDEDACFEARRHSQREYLESLSDMDILMQYVGLDRHDANSVYSFFNRDRWIDEHIADYDDSGCSDEDCEYGRQDEEKRHEMQYTLQKLTDNNSVKVVTDSSISLDEDKNIDTEVCWNYYASKDTIKDNERIIDYLKDQGCSFNNTCGLHINLNNYLELKIPDESIPTKELEALFNVVASSRRDSTYCNETAISGSMKYSMIYHQGDRLEFRFFSPTLNAEKLNHYVVLANVVYKRLVGLNSKLPKKTELYLKKKMVITNNLSEEVATLTIESINSIKSLDNMEKILNEPFIVDYDRLYAASLAVNLPF